MQNKNVLFDALVGVHRENRRVFLTTPSGEVMTYRDAMDGALRLAVSLREMGVAPGDRVTSHLDKRPDALLLYFACLAVGAIYLPLNPSYTDTEVAFYLSDAEPKLLVGEARRAATLAPIVKQANATFATMNCGGQFDIRVEEGIGNLNPVSRGDNDIAALLYTSGTTGRPKGVMLSHDNLLSNARTLVDFWRFTSEDTLLHALPIFHTHGLFVATNVTLLSGASMLFQAHFDLDQFVALLPEATVIMGVPTIYTRLLSRPDVTREVTAGIRLFISGSAPLLAETHQAFEVRTGKRILERYGMTETSMITSNPYDGTRRPGSVGLPLPGIDVRVVDSATGYEKAIGEFGSIEVRGPNVCTGYWRTKAESARDFHEDGFFSTGDVGYIDRDGYLTLIGRSKDLIITGGFNVYPKEVEQVLDSLPEVIESAVVGVPHPDFGEGVVAVVTVRSTGAVSEADISAAISDRIARYKQPKRIIFVEDLPRNVMGKIEKTLIRERYNDLFDHHRHQLPGRVVGGQQPAGGESG